MPEHSGYTARSGLEILGGAQQAKSVPYKQLRAHCLFAQPCNENKKHKLPVSQTKPC